LENVVRWQPSHARAHLALAQCHRRLFDALVSKSENPMSVASLRDAALQSRFSSRAALVEWLSRAVGKHWQHLDQAFEHVRTALALCPIEGRAYVYLADLSFLAGADGAVGRDYVGQALRVRPFDGAVLYAAASDALLAGDRAQWIEYSRRAFHSGRPQQEQIIADLVAATPTENLPAVIESILQEFHPDLAAMRFLHDLCAKRCPAETLAALARCRAEKAESEAARLSPVEGAAVWLEAQRLYGQLGDDAAASRCIGNALRCDLGNYDAHYQGAQFLLKQGRFAEALSHVRWCLQRTPDNPVLADMLREALKGQLDGPRRAATEGEPLR
jgi:tetratricopeptide (TPR) repeat protein